MKKQVSIYIDKEIWEKARKYLRNVSRFCEEKIKEYLKIVGETIEEKKESAKLSAIVKCECGNEFEVVLVYANDKFRSGRVYCKACGKRFTIRRRIKEVFGDMNLYWKWYYTVYGKNNKETNI